MANNMNRLVVLLVTVWFVKATVVPNVYPTKTPPGGPKCGLNEVFSECGANGCQNTCQRPQNSMVCKGVCTPGCICAEGFIKNSKGVCVLIKNCDCTGVNEIFSECDNHGCRNTCKEPDLITRCSYAAGCYPGCICKPGFLKDESGVCVPQSKCYTCKANQVFQDKGSFGCESTCAVPDLQTRCDPNPDSLEPGCFCSPGYVRNQDNGECVLPKDCPKKCTGVHEVYSECGNDSCQKNCDTYDRTDLACRPSCNPGCICETGYIRNQQGVCVTPDQCVNRQCTGKNQVYSLCVSPCGERCSNLGQNIVCNFLVCNPGCDCKPGFFRNSKNECVPPAECDCAANEELDLCHNSCPPRTCDAIGKQFKCAAPDPNNCKPACKCIFNYRRNSDGVCVPIEKCPPLTCTGENEIYKACPPQCLDETCKGLVDPLMCIALVRECSPGCVCKDGYLRNDVGKCIPKEQCSEFCSDPNAIFNTCGNVCPITCSNKDKTPRICPKTCMTKGGCVCKPGFVENYKGVCIPPEKCPKCGPNEVFACGSACDTTCATLGETCPIVNIKCNEKCYCIDGYARNAQNVCIPIKECPPKKCGKNQKYNACPPLCPPEQTCDIYLSGIVVDCPPNGAEARVCTPRCECLPGFVKKVLNGECIKPDQCCSDPNAEVVSCPNPCPGGTCVSPAFANCKAPCRIRGCQCKKGYVKDKDGKCILLSKCPNKQCTGQNEEYSDCGTACPLTCENKDSKMACIEKCVSGCFCKAGFVRKDGKCVKPEECNPRTPVCGPNSTYVKCCPYVQETCVTLGLPICKECKPGCVCNPGFVREVTDGKCIKKCDCKK